MSAIVSDWSKATAGITSIQAPRDHHSSSRKVRRHPGHLSASRAIRISEPPPPVQRPQLQPPFLSFPSSHRRGRRSSFLSSPTPSSHPASPAQRGRWLTLLTMTRDASSRSFGGAVRSQSWPKFHKHAGRSLAAVQSKRRAGGGSETGAGGRAVAANSATWWPLCLPLHLSRLPSCP